MLTTVCRILLPFVWRVTRWVERHVQHHGAHPVLVDGPVQPLTADEVLAAIEAGPIVDTLVDAEGVIRWQGGGGMSRFHHLPTGWVGLKLPPASQVRPVIAHVLRVQTPMAYSLEFEGVPYTGVAFPWLVGESVVGVVLRARPPVYPMPQPQSDARLAEVNRLTHEIDVIAGGTDARRLATAWG